MEKARMSYRIIDGADGIDSQEVAALLKTTYWANKRSLETIEKSMRNSSCYGVYLDEEKKTIRYDVVVSFDSPNRVETYHKTIEEVQKAYPDYKIYGALDTDFSEA